MKKLTETPAQTEQPQKKRGDEIADKILAAFEGQEYLNDADLLKAAGVSRKLYLEVKDYLTTETYELIELDPEEDDAAYILYAKVKPMAGAKE